MRGRFYTFLKENTLIIAQSLAVSQSQSSSTWKHFPSLIPSRGRYVSYWHKYSKRYTSCRQHEAKSSTSLKTMLSVVNANLIRTLESLCSCEKACMSICQHLNLAWLCAVRNMKPHADRLIWISSCRAHLHPKCADISWSGLSLEPGITTESALSHSRL